MEGLAGRRRIVCLEPSRIAFLNHWCDGGIREIAASAQPGRGSAILSPEGAAREDLRRCLTGAFRPLSGNALFPEYEDVMSRAALFAAAPIGPEDRAALPDALLGVCQ